MLWAAHKRVKLQAACNQPPAGQKFLLAESIMSHQPTKLIGWLPFALHFIWYACDELLWAWGVIWTDAVWEGTVLRQTAVELDLVA